MTTTLIGRRVLLRPLKSGDFDQWREVRVRNHDWLTKWEPERSKKGPDTIGDPGAFSLRCHARDREWQLGTGYGFGIFVDGSFAGEINLNSVQRGPFQNAYLGYWMDEARCGQGYIPESVVLVLRYAFGQLDLHRIQISIVPRNDASRRVVEKLGIRSEGTAVRYLEINGVWEDHVRYAVTNEEWSAWGGSLSAKWLD